MAYLVVKHLGVPVLSIEGGRMEDLVLHLSAYPEINEEYAAGNVSAEEVASIDGITFSPMPVTEGILRDKVLKKIAIVLFHHENRIRILEGKAPVTMAQFKDALKTLLGL